MKRIKYILIAFMLVSCANERNNTVSDKAMEIEQYEDSSVKKPEVFEYQNLFTEKLQNYFDLQSLYNKHPEFRKEIKTQLKTLSEDSISITNSSNQIKIRNVKTSPSYTIISDSIIPMKLYFDKVFDDRIIQDSIQVVITKKLITIDDVKRTATKVIFKKY